MKTFKSETLQRFLIYSVSLMAVTLCLGATGHGECERQVVRTRGEYALSLGGMAPFNSSFFQQRSAALGGVGVSLYITPRVAVDGDFFFSNQGMTGGLGGDVWPIAGQLIVHPFRNRDAFTNGCLVPYLGAGAIGDVFGSFQGPSAGGGVKYYFGGVGLGFDGRAIFPQIDATTSHGLRTIYMFTVRLLFQPRKSGSHDD